MNLYINSCARKESRTNMLASYLLEKLGNYEEIDLYKEKIKPYGEENVNDRQYKASKFLFDDDIFNYANSFKEAQNIVISAPYWDMSFPSILKVYIENIFAVGLVCQYNEKGETIGLCRAENLYYVVTSGGKYCPDFSYDYIKYLATQCFGIKHTHLVVAENLDIVGADVEKILNDAKKGIDDLFTKEVPQCFC